MRPVMLCALLLAGNLAISSSTAMTPTNSACQEVAVPVQVRSVASADIYRATNVEPSTVQNVQFTHRPTPLSGKKITQIDPLVSAALLGDGSGIQFIRDPNESGDIKGLQAVRSARCWLEEGDFSYPKREEGRRDELILSDYPDSSPRELLRLENRAGYGRISRVLQFADKSQAATEVVRTLIVSERPIHAFGVSVPSIEGGWRTLMLITQEADGSMTVAGYRYAIRS